MNDIDDQLLNQLYYNKILFPESSSGLTNEILNILSNPKSVTILGQLGIRPSINIIKAIQRNGKANSNQEAEVDNIMKRYLAYMPENHTFHRKAPNAKINFLSTLKNILNKMFMNTDGTLEKLYDVLGKKIANSAESEREGRSMGLKDQELKDHDFDKAESEHERYVSDLDIEDDSAREHLFGDEEVEDEDWALSQMRKNYHQTRKGSDLHGMSIRDEFPYGNMRDEDKEVIKRIRKLNAIHNPTPKPPVDLEDEDEDET